MPDIKKVSDVNNVQFYPETSANAVTGLNTYIGDQAVKYVESQTLTDSQKSLARTNIGAVGQSDVPESGLDVEF